jgi:hypothetical protein
MKRTKGATTMGRMTTAMWWSGLILLFASGLLFGLAVANAEASEAWVLWMHTTAKGTDWEDYRTYGAWPEHGTCELLQGRIVRRFQTQAQTLTAIGNLVVWQSSEGTVFTAKFLCLPATIDPRS